MAGRSILRGFLGRGLPLRRAVLWVCASAALAAGVAADHPQAEDRADPPSRAVSRDAGAVLHRGVELRDGALIRVSGLDRDMTYDAAITESAVVIGDSQTGPGTWVARGLAELGYRTVLRGAGGTGYTVGNGSVGSYHTALTEQHWLLPYGTPKLVVLQGGGNDAGRAADPDIARAAEAIIRELRRTYPQSRLVMVGVISSSETAVGVRRAEVDELLAGVAAQEGVEFLRVGDWWDRYALGALLQPDGRHFTDAGQQAAGTVFAGELGRLLGGTGPPARTGGAG